MRIKDKNTRIDVLMSLRLNIGENEIEDFNKTSFMNMLTSLDMIEECQISVVSKVR